MHDGGIEVVAIGTPPFCFVMWSGFAAFSPEREVLFYYFFERGLRSLGDRNTPDQSHKKRGEGHPHSGIFVFHTNLLCLIVRLIFENKNPQRVPRPAVIARIAETEE